VDSDGGCRTAGAAQSYSGTRQLTSMSLSTVPEAIQFGPPSTPADPSNPYFTHEPSSNLYEKILLNWLALPGCITRYCTVHACRPAVAWVGRREVIGVEQSQNLPHTNPYASIRQFAIEAVTSSRQGRWQPQPLRFRLKLGLQTPIIRFLPSPG